MFLETIKSLLARRKGKNPPTSVAQALSSDEHVAPHPPKSLQLLGLFETPIQSPFPALPSPCIANFDTNATLLQEPTGQIPVTASSPPGFFPNSRDFVFYQPTMVSQVFDSGGGAVMRLLATKRIAGAEVDSSARYPPPRCHPSTRQDQRKQIADWIADPERRWRMLYVLGPAGVGKSALAQTVAEDRKKAGCLGAACFVSRPNHRNDPNGIIPTLAHQLAVKHSVYKQIITQKLADDSTLLEKDRKTQFKELIIDPFRVIMTQHASTVPSPLLIIIDGLDECEGEEAQCEFIELISDHVRSVSEFPLLWMICSRPEWHLKYLLTQPDFQVTCKRLEISVDDNSAQRDVLIYLRDEFSKIRLRHQDSLDDHWPPESQLRRIAAAASGLFAFASTIARFVGDNNAGDPSGNLQTCIRMLGGLGALGPSNPYHALDLLYRQILMTIPSMIWPTTKRILGMSLLYLPQLTSTIRLAIPPTATSTSLLSPQTMTPGPVLPKSPPVMPYPFRSTPHRPPSPPGQSPDSPSGHFSSPISEGSDPPFPSPAAHPLSLIYAASSIRHQANFLRITKSAFYHALKQLHSVLRVPTPTDASKHYLTFYHASFGDFLINQMRSGEFCIEPAAVHYDVAISALSWQTDSIEKQHKDVAWVLSCDEVQTYLEFLRRYSLSIMWSACARLEGEKTIIVIEELHKFDFRTLDISIPDAWEFPEFLIWLYSMQHHHLRARELIDVPEECVLCDDTGLHCFWYNGWSPLLTKFGLNAYNCFNRGKVHCYVGNGSKRRHICIIDVSRPVIPPLHETPPMAFDAVLPEEPLTLPRATSTVESKDGNT